MKIAYENLKYMRQFAQAYPHFPIVQVPLAQLEGQPEFVSKLNFYISAVDEYVKSPEDKPTIGLLLCRTKSDKKAEFSLRGITQPMGIAQYETEKLFADVASALPQIEDIEKEQS